jgi:hypothetical protein
MLKINAPLVISNKKYAEKANERKGGVGTETQIITPNLYAKEKEEKFIPLVLERDDNGEPSLPIYLKSRKYIDFSRIEFFEDSYEELLRNILETPSLPKPKLGTTPPAYITDSTINLSETNNKLKTIENQLRKSNSISIKDINSFIDLFINNLWSFDQKTIPNDLVLYGEQLFNALKSYKPLREDFVKFVDILSSSNIDNFDEILIGFFENAPTFNYPKENSGSWSTERFEIFKIIFHELFIYTIAVCLKNKNYALTADLLHSKYYKKDKHKNNKEPESFTFLFNYHENLENYSFKVFRKVTGFGDYLITNLSEFLNKEDIILADTLCYFISGMEGQTIYELWFPKTYIYAESDGMNFFEKMTSEKYFDRMKILFNVKNKSELIEKLTKTKNDSKDRLSYSRGFKRIPFNHELINPATIAIYR